MFSFCDFFSKIMKKDYTWFQSACVENSSQGLVPGFKAHLQNSCERLVYLVSKRMCRTAARALYLVPKCICRTAYRGLYLVPKRMHRTAAEGLYLVPKRMRRTAGILLPSFYISTVTIPSPGASAHLVSMSTMLRILNKRVSVPF